jgi:spore coat polysaccharide biosynthesis protein SpsF
MGTGLIIFARMRSSRLPGKMLLPIAGRPLLGRVIDRVRCIKGTRQIVVATSNEADDDAIESFARAEGVAVFRGSLEDVAARALACCEAYGLERFARICGDRPFLPWELIDELIVTAEENDLDVASNVIERTYPAGAATEIVAARVLRRTLENTSDPQDREHLTRYIYANPKGFQVRNRRSGVPGWERVNLALDNQSDVVRTEWIMVRLGPRPERARLKQVMALAAEWDAKREIRAS